MTIYARFTNTCSLLTPAILIGAMLIGNTAAQACQAPDKDTAIAGVLAEHPNGKILKVEEIANAKKCVDLQIRVLVNGTVKLVVIEGS